LTGLTTLNEVNEVVAGARVRYSALPYVPNQQLADFFARPVRVGVISVGTTITDDFGASSLFRLWSTKVPVANKLAGYQMFRGEPQVTIQFPGNPVYRGGVLISFHPRALRTSIVANEGTEILPPTWFYGTANVVAKLTLPHISLYAEEAASYSVDLPWPGNREAMFISNGNDWFPMSMILNTFVSNAGATVIPMNVGVYVSYKNVELYNAVEIHGETSGWLSTRVNYVADILGAVGSVVPIVTPWSMLVRGVGSIAAAFGFSRPVSPAMESTHIVTGSSLAYVSGQPDFSEKLALDPAVALDVSGSRFPMSTPEDTRVSFLAGRWGLIARDVEVQDAFFSLGPGAISPYEGGNYPLTPLAFVSSFFGRWRGGLKLKFEIVANAFLRQRFAIVVYPPGETIAAVYTGLSSYATTLVDVVGRTEVEVDVPYQNVMPYTLNTEPYQAYGYDFMATHARVKVYALTTLQGMTGTPVELRMNVSIRAGDGFELALPEITWPNRFIVVHGDVNVVTFGENVVDLLQLTRRSSTNFRTTIDADDIITIPTWGLFPNSGSANYGDETVGGLFLVSVVQWTYLTWLSTAYWCGSGGTRVKFYSAETQGFYTYSLTKLLVSRYNDANFYGASAGAFAEGYDYTTRGAAHSRTALARYEEIELPSRSRMAFTQASNVGKRVSGACDVLAVQRDAGNATKKITFNVSAADDFVLRGFLYAPYLALNV